MKNFKIRAVCGILIAALGLTTMIGCKAKTLDGTRTVVTVDNEEIPLGVVSFALRYAQAQNDFYFRQISALYGEGMTFPSWNEKADGETKTSGERTKEDVINRIAKMSIVRAKALEYNVSITPEEQEQIEAAASEFIANNDESILARIGVTKEHIAEYLELETYYQKAYEPMVADKDTSVSDEEANQSTVTYSFLSNNNLEEAEAEAIMNELLEEYKEQDDIASFDMMALTNEKEEAFMTTTASFGDNDEAGTGLDEAVKEAARTLKDGEMYQEVITGAAGGGYFIVRMDQVSDPEATESKRESLISERKQTAFNELVDEWFENANIVVNEALWKEVKLVDKEAYVLKLEEPEESELPLATEAPVEVEPIIEESVVEEPEAEQSEDEEVATEESGAEETE